MSTVANARGLDAATLTRATATVSAMTLLSRITGFVRVAVVVAVLGTTYLGNTYQTANSVPNLLFELFAAGALQAVLVPELVDLLDRDGRAEVVRMASLVLGALMSVLAVVLVVGSLVAPLLARLLFAGAPAEARADQVWLGTVFLWIFLPQVLFYALGMVSTATLNATNRFAVPAVAPLLNNVVVVSAYLGFWVLLDGDEPRLHLTPLEVAVLAGGTSLGVAAFTSAPLVAAWRAGFRLRPRLDLADPRLRRVARQGLWAGAFLALTQVLLLSALALGNTVEGGSVIYQYAYTAFLLPHSLVAIPIFTALFPSLSRAARARSQLTAQATSPGGAGTEAIVDAVDAGPDGDGADDHRLDDGGADDEYASLLRRGIHAIVILLVPAIAGMIVLAPAAARLMVFGKSAAAFQPVGWAMAAFAPGVAAYGIFLLLARAAYAHGDARLPTMAHLVVTGVGIVGMVVATVLVHGEARIAGLAGAHSAAYLLGAVLLAGALARRRGGARFARPDVLARALGAGVVVAVVMAAGRLLEVDGARVTALVQLTVGGLAGVVVYLVLLRAFGLGDPRRLLHPEVVADA